MYARIHIMDESNYIGHEHEEQFRDFRSYVTDRLEKAAEVPMSQGNPLVEAIGNAGMPASP